MAGWTWFRWGFKVPSNFGNPDKAKNKCFHINRIEYDDGKGLAANLCFDSDGNASVKFIENSQDPEQEAVVPLPAKADLRKWNFVYLNHN